MGNTRIRVLIRLQIVEGDVAAAAEIVTVVAAVDMDEQPRGQPSEKVQHLHLYSECETAYDVQLLCVLVVMVAPSVNLHNEMAVPRPMAPCDMSSDRDGADGMVDEHLIRL